MQGYATLDEIESRIAYMKEKEEVLQKRKEICALPKLRRIIHVTAMYIAGEYQRFYSWKSALKDIFI